VKNLPYFFAARQPAKETFVTLYGQKRCLFNTPKGHDTALPADKGRGGGFFAILAAFEHILTPPLASR